LRMLADLQDMHIWLKSPRGIVPAFQPRHPPNWNLGAIQASLTKKYFWENNLLAGEMGEFGYLGIGSFQLGKEQQARLQQALDKMSHAPGIVIDVRFNVGGNEYFAQQVAARFCSKRVLYARNVGRDDTATGFRETGTRFIAPGASPVYRRPVVLLQGRNCVSSGEGFVAMMRMFDSVTTVGQPTRGASGNPQPFALLPGLEVWSSTWRSLTPDGECHEGVGLAPAVIVDPPAAEFANSDPVLDKALAILCQKVAAEK
jgi:C-terminal processing protease CtpA/Prc